MILLNEHVMKKDVLCYAVSRESLGREFQSTKFIVWANSSQYLYTHLDFKLLFRVHVPQVLVHSNLGSVDQRHDMSRLVLKKVPSVPKRDRYNFSE